MVVVSAALHALMILVDEKCPTHASHVNKELYGYESRGRSMKRRPGMSTLVISS
jgi:hypothetical protein